MKQKIVFSNEEKEYIQKGIFTKEQILNMRQTPLYVWENDFIKSEVINKW